MIQQAYSAWKKNIARVPPPVIIASAAILILLVIGVVIQTVRVMQTPDINSSNVFSQVKADQPLRVVTASQVVDYLKGHRVNLGEVKPYSSSRLKPSEAFTFYMQGQQAIILSYTDTKTLLADRALFAPDVQYMPVRANNSSATIPAPTARPTTSFGARWNVDDVGSVLLLTDKMMPPAIRSNLVSYLYSLIVAPVRPSYPTATP
jgi:hypothetical protein